LKLAHEVEEESVGYSKAIAEPLALGVPRHTPYAKFCVLPPLHGRVVDLRANVPPCRWASALRRRPLPRLLVLARIARVPLPRHTQKFERIEVTIAKDTEHVTGEAVIRHRNCVFDANLRREFFQKPNTKMLPPNDLHPNDASWDCQVVPL